MCKQCNKSKDEEALDMLYLAITKAKCYIEENHKVCDDRAKANKERDELREKCRELEDELEHIEGRFELEHNAKISLQDKCAKLDIQYNELLSKNMDNVRDLTAVEREAAEYKAALKNKCGSCLIRKSYMMLSELSDSSKEIAYKLIERLYVADCGEDDGR